MAALATTSDLDAYIEGSPPSDASRLLERASEMVRATIVQPGVFDDNGDPDSDLDAYQTQALTDATCAQVEYWITVGEDVDIEGPVESFRLGDLSVTYGSGNDRVSPGQLAPRARRHLQNGGLWGRGVIIR